MLKLVLGLSLFLVGIQEISATHPGMQIPMTQKVVKELLADYNITMQEGSIFAIDKDTPQNPSRKDVQLLNCQYDLATDAGIAAAIQSGNNAHLFSEVLGMQVLKVEIYSYGDWKPILGSTQVRWLGNNFNVSFLSKE